MSVAVPSPKPSPAAAALKWVLIAVVAATVVVIGRRAGGEIPRFAEWVSSLGALGPVVFIVGYALAVVAFVPASVLTLAAGAIFGISAGVAYVFCAATLGSSLAFLVSRYIARGAVERRIAGNPGFAAIDQAVAAQGRRIVFLLRLSPAFPFTLLNYALGLTRVRFADYVFASIGMLPGTLLFVYYGKLAGDVAALAGGAPVEKGTGYYAVLLLGLAATVAVTAVVTRTARRALAEATTRKAGASSLLSARSAIERAKVGGGFVPASAVLAHDTSDATTTLDQIVGARESASTGGEVAARQAVSGATARTAVDTNPDHSPVTPLDDHNRRLLDHVRPSDWTNPERAALYDLVVVGAGTGGLICAAVGAGLGARVALVERNLMGGDCLNYGCVPSKAVIRYARRVAEARELLGDAAFDDASLDREFAAAMERMRAIRADISRDDSARRYRDELGVDVFHGSARFTSPSTVDIDGCELRFKRAVVASGARADVPAVSGLRDAGFLTNETVFNLTARPRRLVVLGGGPIGCELAQAMKRLGCDVTLVHSAAHLLHREDADAAAIVQRRFEKEGIRLVLGAEVLSVARESGAKVVRYRTANGESEATCEEILVGTGRRANVEGMGLEAAGITYSDHGVRVDDNLRTTNARVFAVGDCCMRWQFTHAADAAAKIAVQNALFFGRKKLSTLVMPWCTFTDPEIAHVGLYEADARVRGIETDTFTVPLEKVNRAVCDGETDGFVRVHTRKGGDKIVGATIVASHAGEMISEVSLAITSGLGLSKIAAVIHPYPTQAEGIKAAANAYMRTKLTATAKTVLGLLLRVQR